MYKNTLQLQTNWNFDKNYALKYKPTELSWNDTCQILFEIVHERYLKVRMHLEHFKCNKTKYM